MTSTFDAFDSRLLERELERRKVARYASTSTGDLCDALETLRTRAVDVPYDSGHDGLQDLSAAERDAHQLIYNELERRHPAVVKAWDELLATTDSTLMMSTYYDVVIKAAREAAQE